MASSSIPLPSIAGADSAKWNTDFKPYITEALSDTQPKSGSFGISYSVKEDLGALFTRFSNDKDAINEYLVSTYKNIPPPNYAKKNSSLSKVQAQIIIDFYLWASGDDKEFLLRKGTKTLGVYRKTSHYIYDDAHASGYRHRVTYEFVREATEQQKAAIVSAGAVPPTLVWV